MEFLSSRPRRVKRVNSPFRLSLKLLTERDFFLFGRDETDTEKRRHVTPNDTLLLSVNSRIPATIGGIERNESRHCCYVWTAHCCYDSRRADCSDYCSRNRRAKRGAAYAYPL